MTKAAPATERAIPVMTPYGNLLAGILHEPAKPTDTVVVMVHGFLASKQQPLLAYLAAAIAKKGIAAYRFDLSGNGQSEGRFEDATPEKMQEDIAAVVRAMRKRYAKLILLGHSLGGTLALLHAAHEPVDGIIVVSAPVRTVNFAERLSPEQREQLRSVGFTTWNMRTAVGTVPYTITETFVKELMALDPVAIASRIACPVLLLHGREDRAVTIDETMALAQALPREGFAIIDGADHNFSSFSHLLALSSHILPWLEKNAGRQAASKTKSSVPPRKPVKTVKR